MTFATVTVDVEVDLSDVDTDDLVSELENRAEQTRVPNSIEESDIAEMFYAFKLGRPERAMELARKISCDYTGMIL